MTRPVVGLVLGALILAYGVRLVWLQDLFGVPSGQELVGLTILVALLLKQLLGIPLVDAPVARTAYTVAQPPAAKEIAMASDDDEMSFEEQFELLGGASERPPTMAAWGLHLHSPFAPPRASTSWFGGVPRTPSGFDWPRRSDGTRMHFVAQIDLAALTSVSGAAGLPVAVPRTGAMLIFVGYWIPSSFAVRILTPADISAAQDCPVPEDLSPLRDVGFWIDGPTFPRWPLDVTGFADDDHGPPPSPSPPVTTWGLAADDLGRSANGLRRALNMGTSFAEWIAKRDPDAPVSAWDASQEAHLAKQYALIQAEAPELLAGIEALLARAMAQDPLGPVDVAAMVMLDARRAALGGRIRMRSCAIHELDPRRGHLAWNLIKAHHRTRFADLPASHRSFVAPYVTGWRGHRLFGKGLPSVPYPSDMGDLRGHDCIIMVRSDPLLGTETDHLSGFSIWGDRAAMARGDLSTGRCVLHNAG